ncbi:MAG: hypothetical protein H7Y43_12000, partial [Akkermansiaceae bacterium]|nr:hypothetical protein [Verrucomicrobiales bacterium]
MWDASKWKTVTWALLISCVSGLATLRAASFETPLQLADLDLAATADWTVGLVRTNPTFNSYAPANRPEWVLFTKTTKPNAGWAYGVPGVAGLRHVRIGFNRSLPVGTVLAMGESSVSVLATNAAYPGDLGDESVWIPAQRLGGRVLGTNAPLGYECILWVLPPGTTTRALRFSHESDFSDPSYQGTIFGACILADRFANLAPQAVAITFSNASKAALLNNSLIDATWDNGGLSTSPVISPTFPQDLLFVWPTNVSLQGLCALHAGFSEAEVFRYAGPATRHPREALAADWVRIASYTNIQYQVPRRLTPNWLEHAPALSTRAIRLRITKAVNPAKDPYFNSLNGSRVGLGELFALTPLNNLDLESAVLPALGDTHPPIPLAFTLNSPGIVTLVIDDAAGKRVRNLISETPFPAGSNVVWWDGLDESGRVNIKGDGIYEVQGNLVSPGTYRFRGLVRDPLNLRYEFTVGTAGNPPWQIAGGSSGAWLADHRPPSDLIFLPGTNALMLIASEVSESGDGLVWTDLSGNKLKGRPSLVSGGFRTASHLAGDAGNAPVSGVMAYGGYVDGKSIALLAIATSGNPTTLPSATFTNPVVNLMGLAAQNGLLFASVGPVNEVQVLDTRSKKFLMTNSIPDPRGMAFGPGGELWIVSADRLLQCTVNTNTGALGVPGVVIAGGLDDPRKLALDRAGNFYISQWGNSHNVAVFDSQGRPLRTIGVPGLPAAGP